MHVIEFQCFKNVVSSVADPDLFGGSASKVLYFLLAKFYIFYKQSFIFSTSKVLYFLLAKLTYFTFYLLYFETASSHCSTSLFCNIEQRTGLNMLTDKKKHLNVRVSYVSYLLYLLHTEYNMLRSLQYV